jgi:uncharacterized repeat protein (TIGR04138 family)
MHLIAPRPHQTSRVVQATGTLGETFEDVMTTTSKTLMARTRYHRNAYHFVFAALRYTQETLERDEIEFVDEETREEENHISGGELLEGIRRLALEQFGLLAPTVFRHWGVRSTDDFGRIVFEKIECGEMRKTDRDRLSDFFGVYDFDEAFDRQYYVDTSDVFND